jgi:sialate O-acetylesterase
VAPGATGTGPPLGPRPTLQRHGPPPAPLEPVWYQGETNADRGYQYRRLLTDLIASWRERSGCNFTFITIQLANFQQHPEFPGDSLWAELREAQAISLTLPNTGLVTAIDVGDADDIHPTNKRSVGYGQPGVPRGPHLRTHHIRSGAIHLEFDHIDQGLELRGQGGFQIAGADRRWHWAEASLDGAAVVVTSSAVTEPVAVRYACRESETQPV